MESGREPERGREREREREKSLHVPGFWKLINEESKLLSFTPFGGEPLFPTACPAGLHALTGAHARAAIHTRPASFDIMTESSAELTEIDLELDRSTTILGYIRAQRQLREQNLEGAGVHPALAQLVPEELPRGWQEAEGADRDAGGRAAKGLPANEAQEGV